MTDWAELLTSDEFSAYRQRQVDAVAKHVYGLLNHVSHKPEDARELKGALDMAHKLMSLPMTLTTDTTLNAQLAEGLAHDMAGIAAGLVKRKFEG